MAKIVIIGGGAAGMTAAIAAAWADPSHEILILEHKNQLGKKLLSTGNGRCNFTNAYMEKECFYSDSKDVIPCVLDKFGTDETLDFFRKLGVYPKDRNGYYYPRSDQAQTIQQLLILELKALGVTYKTDIHVTEVQRNKKGFRIFTDTPGMSIHADRLILACGGRKRIYTCKDAWTFACSGCSGTCAVKSKIASTGKGFRCAHRNKS